MLKSQKDGGEVEHLQETSINRFLYKILEAKMPEYPIINKRTGEKKEVTMTIQDWERWKIENYEWIRDWSDPSTAPSSFEVGDWQNKLISKHPGWNEVLGNASKAPKSKVKKI